MRMDSHQDYAPRLGIITRWYARHAAFLLAPLWCMVAFGLAIPLFNHVGWVLALASFGAVAMGTVLGGADLSSGAEEYALSLPPSRHQQYWMRALLGLLVPLAALLGVAIVKVGLSARFWGLFCSSGWTFRFAEVGGTAFAVAAVVIPSALFCLAYAGATLGGIPGGLLASLLLVVTSAMAAMVETKLFGQPNGRIHLSAAGTLGVLCMGGGYPLYLKRDAACGARRSQSAAIAIIACVLVVLGLLLVLGSVRQEQGHIRTSETVQRSEEVRTIQMSAESEGAE